MGISYIYKLKNIKTGKYYIGVQYGKQANPLNLWNTYFTSSKYVNENKNDFTVVYAKPRKDSRQYEARFLQRIYNIYGKDKFCEILYNRNLAPGIINDDNERKRISERLKQRWNSGKMKGIHKKATETRKKRTYKQYNHSPAICESISKRMKKNNPMFREDVKEKHKKSINTLEITIKKSERAKGNTYNKGRKWYNNGKISKMLYECPEDWVAGRLNPHWNYKRKINEQKTT
jgi:hypothetical protein